MRNYNIFFSYTLKDNEINSDILQKIKKTFSILENVQTYFDILDNHSINHQDYVFKALTEANILCLIKSSNINTSCWVNKEIEFAKKRNLPIIEINRKDIEEILASKTKQELLANKKVKMMMDISKISIR
nr:TIR domain-containing protein [uncultured Lachnoclostridium sp.]